MNYMHQKQIRHSPLPFWAALAQNGNFTYRAVQRETTPRPDLPLPPHWPAAAAGILSHGATRDRESVRRETARAWDGGSRGGVSVGAR